MDSFEKEYPDLAEVCKYFWDCGIESEQFYSVEISNIELLLQPFSISKRNSFLSSYFFEKNLYLDKIAESSSNTNNNIINNKRPHSPEDTIVAALDNPSKRSNLDTPVEEPFTFKKNEIYYLIEGNDQGNYILRKYEKFRNVDFSKIIPIVIYRYINKDPLFYMISSQVCKTKGCFAKSTTLKFTLHLFIFHNNIHSLDNVEVMCQKITTPVFLWLRDQLAEVFPTTEKDLWYIAHAKSTSTSLEISEGGKLYWSYKEIRRKYRKVGIIVDDNDNEENATDEVAAINAQSAKIQLFASFYDCLTDVDREKYNDVIVTARWTDTFKQRIDLLCRKEGKNFLLTPELYVSSFKCLLDHSSISLLESDFETIINEFYILTKTTTEFYAKSETFFETEWPSIAKNFMTIVKGASGQKIKDFKITHQSLIDAGKHDNLLALFALPWYLNNTHEGITRKQAADAFFLHLQDDSNLAVDRENHEKILEKLSIRIPLYVILCGTIESISKSYLVFNGTIISYSNPFKAILTCIKCQAALRSWPIACEPIYAFFQFIIYKIPMNKSLFFVYKTHASAKNLIEKLQINKI